MADFASPPPPPAPQPTPDFCWIQAVNEKFAQPTCCLRGEILSGVPLVFGGALQFQVSTAEYRIWRKSSGWRMGDEAVPCPVKESDECLLLKVNWGMSQWGWDAAAKTGGRSPIPACLAGSLALSTSPTCRQ